MYCENQLYNTLFNPLHLLLLMITVHFSTKTLLFIQHFLNSPHIILQRCLSSTDALLPYNILQYCCGLQLIVEITEFDEISTIQFLSPLQSTSLTLLQSSSSLLSLLKSLLTSMFFRLVRCCSLFLFSQDFGPI